MIPERTDDEKLAISPIKIKLGEKDYELKVRRILQAREWREQLMRSLSEILAQMNPELTSIESFVGGVGVMYLRFPEKVAELVFSYDPALDRAAAEAEATEEQLAVAFSSILKVAFPFVSELSMVNQVLKTAAILSPSARPTS